MSLTMSHCRSLALAAVGAGLLFPAVGRAQSETVRLSGQTVAVYNLAGAVSLTAGSGSDVVVTVNRQGSDGGRLTVEQGPLDLRQGNWGTASSLRVIYPSDRIRYSAGGFRGRTELRVREDGTFWGNDSGRGGRRVEISDREGIDASADLAIAVPSGKRVLVALAAGSIEARNVNGDLRLDTGSGEIRTARTSGSLNLDTGSGDVWVDGAEGEVSIDTGSGSVDVRSVRGPELEIDTGSGDVTVDGADAREIGVDTGSGEVSLLGARTDRISVDTGSGDVVIEAVAGSPSIEVDTGSGDVTLGIPADYAGHVLIETSSGRMRTEFPLTLISKDDDEIEGRIGSGGNARISIDTGSGDVSLRRS